MAATTEARRRRWTRREIRRMGELGILPSSGVRLIDGEVRGTDSVDTRRRWSYDEVVRMVRGGVLDADERIELINGDIVCMTPVGHRHQYVVDLLTEFLGARVRGRGVLRVQGSVLFDWLEAPQPDLVVFRMMEDRYRSREPGAWDALLVVEVADTSLARDLEKAALYASARIPEYWIVELQRSVVRVLRDPVGLGYADAREFGHGEVFTCEVLGGEVAVDEVLGPPIQETRDDACIP
jgi:Uma2 family endonuclease